MQLLKELKCGALLITPNATKDRRGTCAEVDLKSGEVPTTVRELYVVSGCHVLRGMHFQHWKHAPLTKVVRCVEGKVLEGLIDMRTGKGETFILDSEKGQILVVPPWCAHGYLVVSFQASLLYGFDAARAPEHERVVRWNSAGLRWPAVYSRDPDLTPCLSDRDAEAPTLKEVMAELGSEAA